MIGALTFVPLLPFSPSSLPPTKDGAGLTQGPVSRELPTGLAGLAGLTVRGAWGGDGKEGSNGAEPSVLPPTRQTDLAWFPGTAAPPNHHTHPCPQGLSKRGHARLGGDRPPSWVVRGLGPLGCRGGRGAQGRVGTSTSHWQKEGGGLHPTHPSQMMGLGLPPWPDWQQHSSRWHFCWHGCQSPG